MSAVANTGDSVVIEATGCGCGCPDTGTTGTTGGTGSSGTGGTGSTGGTGPVGEGGTSEGDIAPGQHGQESQFSVTQADSDLKCKQAKMALDLLVMMFMSLSALQSVINAAIASISFITGYTTGAAIRYFFPGKIGIVLTGAARTAFITLCRRVLIPVVSGVAGLVASSTSVVAHVTALIPALATPWPEEIVILFSTPITSLIIGNIVAWGVYLVLEYVFSYALEVDFVAMADYVIENRELLECIIIKNQTAELAVIDLVELFASTAELTTAQRAVMGILFSPTFVQYGFITISNQLQIELRSLDLDCACGVSENEPPPSGSNPIPTNQPLPVPASCAEYDTQYNFSNAQSWTLDIGAYSASINGTSGYEAFTPGGAYYSSQSVQVSKSNVTFRNLCISVGTKNTGGTTTVDFTIDTGGDTYTFRVAPYGETQGAASSVGLSASQFPAQALDTFGRVKATSITVNAYCKHPGTGSLGPTAVYGVSVDTAPTVPVVGAATQPSPITTSPILFYVPDYEPSIPGRSVGDTANQLLDLSTNLNHALAPAENNEPLITQNGILFNGLLDYLVVTNTGQLDLGNVDFRILALVKVETMPPPGGSSVAVCAHNAGQALGFILSFDNAGEVTYWHDTAFVTTGAGIAAGGTYLIDVKQVSSALTISVNGVEKFSGAGNGIDTDGISITIGATANLFNYLNAELKRLEISANV